MNLYTVRFDCAKDSLYPINLGGKKICRNQVGTRRHFYLMPCAIGTITKAILIFHQLGRCGF